eukprot:6470331-Amphidinium_carterae.1
MPLSAPGESGGRGIGVNAGGQGKLSLAPCTRLTPICSSSLMGSPPGASVLQSLLLATEGVGLPPLPLGGFLPLPLALPCVPGVNGVGVNGAART